MRFQFIPLIVYGANHTHALKLKPGRVEKNSLTIGPLAGIKPAPLRWRCTSAAASTAKLRLQSLQQINKLNIVRNLYWNYTVREVLIKNRTRVWRNVYNTARECVARENC